MPITAVNSAIYIDQTPGSCTAAIQSISLGPGTVSTSSINIIHDSDDYEYQVDEVTHYLPADVITHTTLHTPDADSQSYLRLKVDQIFGRNTPGAVYLGIKSPANVHVQNGDFKDITLGENEDSDITSEKNYILSNIAPSTELELEIYTTDNTKLSSTDSYYPKTTISLYKAVNDSNTTTNKSISIKGGNGSITECSIASRHSNCAFSAIALFYSKAYYGSFASVNSYANNSSHAYYYSSANNQSMAIYYSTADENSIAHYNSTAYNNSIALQHSTATNNSIAALWDSYALNNSIALKR